MKKLVSNSNPFLLLLAPVVFAIIMGVSYQFEQKRQFAAHNTTVQATSLFIKGIAVVKTVCSVATEKLW
ncbi:hypothetical protein ACFQZX_16285 [Mucilaginibacter litoreus]|uniref:Uncharacterized protein n=1 Tax=Mucilaginibacter litoreus TaxID=1048221 RepID=A0ABW3AVT4_9SPHI